MSSVRIFAGVGVAASYFGGNSRDKLTAQPGREAFVFKLLNTVLLSVRGWTSVGKGPEEAVH